MRDAAETNSVIELFYRTKTKRAAHNRERPFLNYLGIRSSTAASVLHHRTGGEVRGSHGAHVDVPAFALGRVWRRQVAEAREPALDVGAGAINLEQTLERIDRNSRIGHRPIAI